MYLVFYIWWNFEDVINVCYICCMMLCKVLIYGYLLVFLDRICYLIDNRVFKLV